MQSVVVTGSSTGIGEGCALRLDKMGWRVFAGVRRREDGEALKQKASERLVPVILDVTDSESIAAATRYVAEVVGEEGLDGLVNNAGIAVAGPLEFLPVDELRRQLDVNVVGQIAVTQAFLPLLRKARGRIVNIGSVSSRISVPLLGPYSASKFAMDALTTALRMELQPWGIHVAIVDPSGIATPIWRKSMAAGERLAERFPPEVFELYGPIIEVQRKRAVESDRTGLPRSAVTRPVAHALTSPRPRTRYPVGSTARIVAILRLLPDRLRERLLMSQMK
jgi:NAD(P)-dependent dehydrogenase (short-subunit alcohol dehydrogenase family)